jgi:hypothetical protein
MSGAARTTCQASSDSECPIGILGGARPHVIATVGSLARVLALVEPRAPHQWRERTGGSAILPWKKPILPENLSQLARRVSKVLPPSLDCSRTGNAGGHKTIHDACNQIQKRQHTKFYPTTPREISPAVHTFLNVSTNERRTVYFLRRGFDCPIQEAHCRFTNHHKRAICHLTSSMTSSC